MKRITNLVIVGWLSDWGYPLKDQSFWTHFSEIEKVRFQNSLVEDQLPLDAWILPLRESDISDVLKSKMSLMSLLPPQSTIHICGDKGRFLDFMHENSLSDFVPKSYGYFSKDAKFPLILKPYISKASDNIFICNNRFEIFKHLLLGKIHFRQLRRKFLAQEYIQGGHEFTFYCVCVNGEILWSVSRYRKLNDDFLSPQDVYEVDYLLEIPEECKKVFRKCFELLRFSGPVTIDFTMVDGKPLIFEINPRFGGGLFTSPQLRPALIKCLRVILKNLTVTGKQNNYSQ